MRFLINWYSAASICFKGVSTFHLSFELFFSIFLSTNELFRSLQVNYHLLNYCTRISRNFDLFGVLGSCLKSSNHQNSVFRPL